MKKRISGMERMLVNIADRLDNMGAYEEQQKKKIMEEYAPGTDKREDIESKMKAQIISEFTKKLNQLQHDGFQLSINQKINKNKK